MSSGSRCAIRGVSGTWYGPVASTTWSAVSVPRVVRTSKPPPWPGRRGSWASRVAVVCSATGGPNDRA
jgi:hypothetical protein